MSLWSRTKGQGNDSRGQLVAGITGGSTSKTLQELVETAEQSEKWLAKQKARPRENFPFCVH